MAPLRILKKKRELIVGDKTRMMTVNVIESYFDNTETHTVAFLGSSTEHIWEFFFLRVFMQRHPNDKVQFSEAAPSIKCGLLFLSRDGSSVKIAPRCKKLISRFKSPGD